MSWIEQERLCGEVASSTAALMQLGELRERGPEQLEDARAIDAAFSLDHGAETHSLVGHGRQVDRAKFTKESR